ncbi:MAG: membrane receptor protein [Halieaceae bacterium]|nr:membrane receptor protein [Halieaceae bacterium]|tara:strand:+ start:470 stop:2659 length:2190 start_codon:yes stop_codon:yes gene_type:complete
MLSSNLAATRFAAWLSRAGVTVIGCLGVASATVAELEEVLIVGSKTAVQSVSGSASFLDEEDLERFDQIDLRKVLNQVPGVYIREEDGFGLRPNIGIRGAAAERSQKVTIMRDGVLITPAPYSAPAAYYIPNVSRIASVEVLKGPAATAFGPHTVGGAINLASPNIPDEDALGLLDFSMGSDGYYKAQGSYGGNEGSYGYLIDVLTYGADGFKSVDQSDQETGFERNDIGLKLTYAVPDSQYDHTVTVLLEAGDEVADETYLGLSDDDFRETPLRRYSASQLARFESQHYNAQLNYSAQVSRFNTTSVAVYWNKFDRSWNKLDRFWRGPALQRVLQAPEQYQIYYSILTGDRDSSPSPDQTLDVTNNHRKYQSYGAQWTISDSRELAGAVLNTSVGLRFHHDQVKRNHQPITYLMTDYKMVPDGIPRSPKTQNKATTDAWAGYVTSKLSYGNASVMLGIRHEDIDGEVINFITDSVAGAEQHLTAASISGIWQISEHASFFAGAYEGFSPAGPASGADHEQSMNYELGARISSATTQASMIGFYSDYDNLIGRCRVSDPNCTPGSEFNGGQVDIGGAELSLLHRFSFSDASWLEFAVSYTYTESEFGETFLSGFSQWGLVREGDELPYVPEHIGNLRVSYARNNWRFEGSVDFQSSMREVPGIGEIAEDLHADDLTTIDLTFSYELTEALTLQGSLLNATDEAAIVSHRPFGARPNRPRALIGRIKYRF